MDIGQLIKSDEALKAIDDGVWVRDLPGAPGVALKVRGFRSEAAQKKTQALKTKARTANGKPLEDDEVRAILDQVATEDILLDWEGITQGGKPLKYSKAVAQKMCSRHGEGLRNLVIEAANRVDSETGQFIEGVTKN